MPWKYIGSDEAGYSEVFVDQNGSIHRDAQKSYSESDNGGWVTTYSPITVDKQGIILENGSCKTRDI